MAALVGEMVREAFPELFVEGNVVAAEQSFHRRLAEYEMNIEQQKLLREDLRDLVELTVGRMDVYHLVGAMLLEFCIAFFCENHMVEAKESEMPPWVLNFFLLSNLSAAGYLVFAVWLSMHASVASHSIGVRLLTRFARLSIPTREELEDVARAPLVPVMERFIALGKRFGLGRAGSEGEEGGAGAAKAAHTGGGRPSSSSQAAAAAIAAAAAAAADAAGLPPPPAPAPPPAERGLAEQLRGGDVSGLRAIDEGAKVVGDRSLHFRKFLKEQRRWLCYDAYARVCMSLGINQMMCALSYYTVGVYVGVAPSAALLTLLGIQWLAVLLLRLDVVPGSKPVREVAAMLCFVPLPPIYVGCLIAILRYFDVREVALSFLATPAFLCHGAWLAMVACILLPARGAADLSALPKQLRTVLYLDVLHMEQDEAADRVHAVETQGGLEELERARLELESRMQAIILAEAGRGAVSSSRRREPELQELAAGLREQIQTARRAMCSNPQQRQLARAEVKQAERALDRLAVWQKAPDMHACLEALRKPKVQEWLTDEQRKVIDQSYKLFLHHCQAFNLGIVMPGSLLSGGSAETTDTASSFKNALRVEEGEERAVRVEAPPELNGGWLPLSVWIDPQTNAVQHEQPAAGRATSFNQVVDLSFRDWTDQAVRLRRQATMASQRSERSDMEGRPSTGTGPPGLPPRSFTRASSIIGPFLARDREPPLVPERATPPEQLPGAIVRRFTFGVAALWVVAAAAHLVACAQERGEVVEHSLPDMLAEEALEANWPEPRGLFEVASLFCNASLLLVHSRFAVHAASWRAPGALAAAAGAAPAPFALGPFQEVAAAGARSAVACAASGCDLLSPAKEAGAWRLRSLVGPPRADSEVPLPEQWRLVAFARAPCAPEPCERIVLAGWDGLEVVVAHATRSNAGGAATSPPQPEDGGEPQRSSSSSSSSSWQVRSRFAVRPGSGPCSGSGCLAGGSWPSNYSEVLALQLGPRGDTLSVLLGGGVLDGWDLAAGRQTSRWSLWRAGGGAPCCARRGPGNLRRPGATAGASAAPPHAFCQDGAGHLVLARRASGRDGRGPRLAMVAAVSQEAAATLPAAGCLPGRRREAAGLPEAPGGVLLL